MESTRSSLPAVSRPGPCPRRPWWCWTSCWRRAGGPPRARAAGWCAGTAGGWRGRRRTRSPRASWTGKSCRGSGVGTGGSAPRQRCARSGSGARRGRSPPSGRCGTAPSCTWGASAGCAARGSRARTGTCPRTCRSRPPRRAGTARSCSATRWAAAVAAAAGRARRRRARGGGAAAATRAPAPAAGCRARAGPWAGRCRRPRGSAPGPGPCAGSGRYTLLGSETNVGRLVSCSRAASVLQVDLNTTSFSNNVNCLLYFYRHFSPGASTSRPTRVTQAKLTCEPLDQLQPSLSK